MIFVAIALEKLPLQQQEKSKWTALLIAQS